MSRGSAPLASSQHPHMMHSKEREEEIPLNVRDSSIDRSEEDVGSFQHEQVPRRISAHRLSRCAGIGIALFVLVCVSVWVGAAINSYSINLDEKCAEHTTEWSPLLRDVKVKYSTRQFDGRFMKENIFRGNASPKVDAAWEALGVDYRPGIISYEDGLASGLGPHFVQRTAKYGGGFVVNVEGMHHLHCLNLLRKSLHWNYDYYRDQGRHAFKNSGDVFRLHVTHCLDTIRQVLMCNVDTGVLGQVWTDPEYPVAFPDFNTKHKCKNYDDIRNWAKKLATQPDDELPHGYVQDPKPGDVLEFTP